LSQHGGQPGGQHQGQHGLGPTTALLLTGGGARAAYQVGVLKAVARLRRDFHAPRENPFGIIVGTSAGAINAAALASHADQFDLAVAEIANVWKHFRTDQVYRADSFGVIRTGAKWLTMLTAGWAFTRWRKAKAQSLLDNAPLRALMNSMVHLPRLHEVMRGGHLKALAVTASSYSSGDHVTFYDALDPVAPWARQNRLAVPSPITVDHLMASSAIPFVFPAVPLPFAGQSEWFGDGSMRQSAPISPAVHLGAERILIVGAGRMQEPTLRRPSDPQAPNLAQIGGHALSSIFLDGLATDVERLSRINQTLGLLTPEARAQTSLRPIQTLVISPSQRLDDIAARHLQALPTPVRALLRGVGVEGQGADARGAALASYLLFESVFTKSLMLLGEADTLTRRNEVAAFFGWERRAGARQSGAADVVAARGATLTSASASMASPAPTSALETPTPRG
jgi:NTE family protein